MMDLPPWSERFGRPAMARLAFGLAVGAAGGAVAHWLHVPLAWMLGPLFFCMAAAVAGLPVDVPMWLRANFLVVVGLFLGESFDGLSVDQIARWPISMAAAVLYVPVAAFFAYLFYRYGAREDRMTATCSAIPGGLTAVILISGSLGGDERSVALSQSLRIAIVIFAAPAIAFGLLGFTAPTAEMLDARPQASAGEVLVLLLAGAAGAWAFTRAGVPLGPMLGPILTSAALRVGGLVEGALPHWFVEIALVVTGASIGCRFHGTGLRLWLSVAGATLVGTAILMAVSAVFAAGVAGITGVGFFAALLAFAPGGIAEMSLIAIAIDADPGFVAVHHVTRIGFILLAVPVFAAWLQRVAAREKARGT